MKILQLLEEPYQTSAFEPKDFGTAQRLGQGLYSNVYKNSDEFTVDKSSIYSGDRGDPFWDYIAGILNNDDLKSNPFAPRIFSVNYKTHNANIERLYSGNDIEKMGIDFRLLQNYLSSIIELNLPIIGTKEWDELPKYDKYKYFPYWHKAVCQILDTAAIIDNTSKIKNDKLSQLIKYIHDVYSSIDGVGIDIHGGNVMYRIIPTGVQLVITDPLSEK